ncbi:hypothetical protein [Winslowiella toletana]|uniref:hypothetical protein n=1 Tax=Winslowiella toletana TaxID=92490 RepID=UPI0028BDE06D|nr:hypothetical protein [Winslowiella toletana]WNN43883.1 hypothetical protein RIN69_19830 [Winslowiella toletana]
MSGINTNNLNINAPTGMKSGGDTEYLSAGKNTSLMGAAMVTMDSIMLLFTELANAKFEQMSKKTEVSRDAQDMANRVDALLAGLASGKDTAALPQDIIEYMRANNIQVNGMSIDKFLGLKPADDLPGGPETPETPEAPEAPEAPGTPGTPGASEAAKFVQMLNALLASAPAEGVQGSQLFELLDFMKEYGIPLGGDMLHLPNGGNASLWQIEQLRNQLTAAFPDAGFNPGTRPAINPDAPPVDGPVDGPVNGPVTGPVELDKAALTAIKSALESYSGRASDFVQQNQLKLQQLMQNFNTAVTMANSVQSMNAESTKSIAQSIR